MLRTIKESLEIIKSEDPDTAITEYHIRKLAKESKIDFRNSGKKILINVVSMKDYFGINKVS